MRNERQAEILLSTNIWTLIFTVINLIILFVLLKKFLFGRVNKILDKRADIIQKQFSDADKAQKDAENLKQEYENSLLNAKQESAAIVDDARTKARTEYDRIISNAGQEADKLMDKARQDIELERKKSMQSLESEIADLVISATTKVVGEKNTEENNRELYDKFITEMGEKDETDIN